MGLFFLIGFVDPQCCSVGLSDGPVDSHVYSFSPMKSKSSPLENTNSPVKNNDSLTVSIGEDLLLIL